MIYYVSSGIDGKLYSLKPGFHLNAINRLHCVCCVKIMVDTALTEHSYWLAANASACVYCGFRLRNARNASD